MMVEERRREEKKRKQERREEKRDFIFITLSEHEGIKEDYRATLHYADNARFLKRPKFRHALF